MKNIAIIIPARLNALRLPNKPLKLINNKEMILHVLEVAEKAKVGEVFVATPDQQIFDLIKSRGGKAVITSKNHETGTDRVYEVFKKKLNSKHGIIINYQGDMPNLDPLVIKNLANHMKKGLCDIATLASDLKSQNEEKDPNTVKVIVDKKIEKKGFSRAKDFYRISNESSNKLTYHHIGIYAFTNKALIRYVSLERSKLEIKRKLEQLRALDNKMKINVGHVESCPLSVDTELDLKAVKKIMEK